MGEISAPKITETRLQHEIRQAVNASGLAIVMRNNIGFDRERGVKYGLGLGSPDLIGCLIPSGRMVAIEVKTPIGRVSPEQRAWHNAWGSRGVLVIVARSVQDAMFDIGSAL